MKIINLKDINLEELKRFNKRLEAIENTNASLHNEEKKIKNLNEYLTKYTFFNEITITNFKKNICLLKLDREELKVAVLISYNAYIFDVDIIQYKWFVRYRIKTPFAIKKERGKDIHCLFISFDFNRKSFLGIEGDKEETVLDDEIPINIYLGDLKKFTCIGIASSFNKDDFSTLTQINYIDGIKNY